MIRTVGREPLGIPAPTLPCVVALIGDVLVFDAFGQGAGVHELGETVRVFAEVGHPNAQGRACRDRQVRVVAVGSR